MQATAAALLALGVLRLGAAADECKGRPDGYTLLPGSGCRQFALCLSGRVAGRRVCAGGTLFDGHGCVPQGRHRCSEQTTGPCAGLPDGPFADPAGDCRDYIYCVAGAMVVRARCDRGLVWNGTACADAARWTCDAAQPWDGCRGLPPGLHRDRSPSTNCRRYFHCASGNRTVFACPADRVFDGRSCVPGATHVCPSTDEDPCIGAPDGYHPEPGSGCRSYFFCSGGHKITYVCPRGFAFDGQMCAPSSRVPCDQPYTDCVSRRDGYYADTASDCRRYYYCLAGDRVITLSCQFGRVFDGRGCIEGSRCRSVAPAGSTAVAAASAAPAITTAPPRHPTDGCDGTPNGFYQDFQSNCRTYYYCIDGRKTSLVCSDNMVFDGQLCVDTAVYSCPLSRPSGSL